VADPAAGGGLVGGAIAALLGRKPDAVLGLATGSSPEPVYDDLSARSRAGTVSFADASGFQLDEYVGLPPEHPQSYRSVLTREVVERLGFRPGSVQGPDGMADDLAAACSSYEESIERAGGIDVQLLGVGSDGHIGFNEPVSSLASRTRLKTLTEQTRQDNARFFDGDIDAVPRHVITQGIATILSSRHAVLVAWGERKAKAVARCVEGPVTAFCPGSALQLHAHATVVIDEAAAGELELGDYYRHTWASKPAWQGI
jgi:glucosamine-6-phosphate deaminase